VKNQNRYIEPSDITTENLEQFTCSYPRFPVSKMNPHH
jgi:hypothetical protein